MFHLASNSNSDAIFGLTAHVQLTLGTQTLQALEIFSVTFTLGTTATNALFGRLDKSQVSVTFLTLEKTWIFLKSL